MITIKNLLNKILLLLKNNTDVPFFQGYYTTPTAAITSFSSTIILNNIITDTHNAYNITTGKYTVPKDGYYLVNINLYGTINEGNRVMIMHNDSMNTDDCNSFIYTENCCSYKNIYKCKKGDTLQFCPCPGFTLQFWTGPEHNLVTITQLI